MAIIPFPGVDARGVRVVIAEDHQALRKVLKHAIQRVCECAVEVVGEAVDGAEAFGMVERLQPDVVILDVSLPAMEGIAATKAIHQRFESVVVFAWTTYDDEWIRESMLDAGAKKVFLKDGTFEKLAKAICEICDPEDPPSIDGIA